MYAQRNINYPVKHQIRNNIVMDTKCASSSFSTILSQKIFPFYTVESIALFSSWCLFYVLKFSQFVIFINHS